MWLIHPKSLPCAVAAIVSESPLAAPWRFEVAGWKVGVGVPLVWGLGADGYYLNDRGGNAALGYFSSAVTASVSLPSPTGWGEWFMNASFQYLHLFADNLVLINDGRHDAFVGKLGVGFHF